MRACLLLTSPVRCACRHHVMHGPCSCDVFIRPGQLGCFLPTICKFSYLFIIVPFQTQRKGTQSKKVSDDMLTFESFKTMFFGSRSNLGIAGIEIDETM